MHRKLENLRFEILYFAVVKVKVAGHLYSASSEMLHFWSTQAWITQILHCKAHHTCLYSIVRQRAPRLNEQLMKLTTHFHLTTPWGWKAELALLADLQLTVYPYKWLLISCRSGADQWKFAGQRPTFYHWATQPFTNGSGTNWWGKEKFEHGCTTTALLLSSTPPCQILPCLAKTEKSALSKYNTGRLALCTVLSVTK